MLQPPCQHTHTHATNKHLQLFSFWSALVKNILNFLRPPSFAAHVARTALLQDPAKTSDGNHTDTLHFFMMLHHHHPQHKIYELYLTFSFEQKPTFYVFYCHSHSLPYGVAACSEEETFWFFLTSKSALVVKFQGFFSFSFFLSFSFF